MAPARKPKTKEMMSALMRPPSTVTAGTNGLEQQDDDRLEQQRQDDQRHHRAARDERQDHRPHEQVEQRDEDDRDEAAAQLVDVQLRQQPGRDVERDDARDERDDAPA